MMSPNRLRSIAFPLKSVAALIVTVWLGLSLLTSAQAQNSTAHPRLWLTANDLPRLRSWASSNNPLYADGLALLAERAKAEMDEGRVPNQDCGNVGYEEYPTEMYAELFAFLSLVENEATARADYAARARTLLMHIMNEAVKGPATAEDYTCNESQQYPPFRHPDFFTSDRDRARYHGEAFPLVVDWIYPSLSAADKATIRTVFLRWSQEIIERGYHHPEPVGLINDPALLADKAQVRFSGNNYYAAHMRNLGLMALALDPADDADNQLHNYLNQASGAYLYIFDYLTRQGDSRGGLLPEGFEYSPQTAGYATQFLLALRTAEVTTLPGFGDPALPYQNPFWNDFVTAYFHSLSPAKTIQPAAPELGPMYQVAWYGDAQHYQLADFIDAFAPLGIYDGLTNNTARLNAIRWLETHTAPGGATGLLQRVRNPDDFRRALLYFMLFDPAVTPTDPRPSLATDFLAEGMGRFFSRTSWESNANWFTYALSWNSIDHQMADGNSFAFYRQGEWLTKGRTGYADIAEGIASSEFYNTLGLQNDKPERDDTDWRTDLWQRGSQWNYVNVGDPKLLASSANATFAYALGDATNLYNSSSENATDILQASRSIVWLKPDHILVYDRAESKTARFKRWWLQLPTPATVEGNLATMTTSGGQKLFVTSLLPLGATLTPMNSNELHIEDTVANDEPMKVRLQVEAPGNPTSTRFLQLLQGANAGAAADAVTLIQSEDKSYEGAQVRNTVVLFPVNLTPARRDLSEPTAVDNLSYTVSAAVGLHLIMGLTPTVGYNVITETVGSNVRVILQSGGALMADSGGVLRFGEPTSGGGVSVYLPLIMK